MKQLLQLVKPRIALLTAVSTAAGALLAGPHIFWPVLGTFLLACGAAALNQIQERDLDALMPRTRHRPLPTGAITVRAATIVVIVFLAAGLAAFACTGNLITVALGALAVLAYNFLYTPLKRVTTIAPVVGTIVGAFPPAIGWTGAGGAGCPPALVALTIFFIVWQLPHFWLLWQRTAADYAAAGLPAPTARLDAESLQRVTLVWILAVAALGLMLPLFGVVQHLAALALAALWLGVQASRSPARAFVAINLFAGTLLATIILERTLL